MGRNVAARAISMAGGRATPASCQNRDSTSSHVGFRLLQRGYFSGVKEVEPHVIAVTKQDNGELAEDVVARELVESEDDETANVVDVTPMPDHDRPHPAAPLPGTLSRD